jgi:hypothetical protein
MACGGLVVYFIDGRKMRGAPCTGETDLIEVPVTVVYLYIVVVPVSRADCLLKHPQLSSVPAVRRTHATFLRTRRAPHLPQHGGPPTN